MYTSTCTSCCFKEDRVVAEQLQVCSPVEQRLQPALMTLAVAVQEGQHLPRAHRRPQQPGPDQPLPLGGPDQSHLPQAGQVLLQRLLQVL